MFTDQLAHLRTLATEASERALVPYSGSKEAVVLLLSDGFWIPGVRVESATYSLVIKPLLNAVTASVALERSDVVAAVMSRPLTPSERTYAALDFLLRDLQPHASDALVHHDGMVPDPTESLSPVVHPDVDLEDGVSLAREIAGRAFVPESSFPVGCIIRAAGTGYVPGVNVEHPDWSQILCAERNALGTCVSYGLIGSMTSMHLTCLKDESATPCGACRQLMVELAPTATLWMDRGESAPSQSDPVTLLPGSFNGERLSSKT